MQAYPRINFVHGRVALEATCTPELASMLTDAVELNRPMYSTTDVSFYSLLFAFLTSEDAWSQWFQDQLNVHAVNVAGLLAVKNFTEDLLLSTKSPAAGSVLPNPIRATTTAFQWIQGAMDSVQNPSDPLDVSHMIHALLTTRTKRHGTLEKNGFNASALLEVFSRELAAQTRRQAENTMQSATSAAEGDVSEPPLRSAGPTLGAVASPPSVQAVPVAEVAQFSLHIESDIATSLDRLNYQTYCDALRAFILSPRTTFPLSVSIQAQWGGGKSSLMRMIRAELDPKFRKSDAEVRAQERWQEGPPLLIRDAARVVEEFRRDGELAPKDAIDAPSSSAFHLTVWFNAWKYENSDQVWAGLVDAIVREITTRMRPTEREKFFIRLNLRRIDPGKVREAIYQRAFAEWLRAGAALWTVLAGVGGALIGALLSFLPNAAQIAPTLTVAGGAIGALATLFRTFVSALKKTEDKQAAVALRDVVSAPDYRTNFGFVHDVEADFRKILEIVPHDYWPIVVFIDDLDRCSPETISKVVEGVNLFLAGDFPDFVFILGMDAELVAAALDAAHNDVLAFLTEGVNVPLGWRFMDKFVQLPFLIPPPSSLAYDAYINGLLIRAESKASGAPAPPPGAALTTGDAATDRGVFDRATSTAAAATPHAEERAKAAERLQRTIATYDESDPRVAKALRGALRYLARNPRDAKRFLNTLRFHNFLANAAVVEEPLSLRQIVAWTVVCVKWPQLARWVRRNDASDTELLVAGRQLKALENAAAISKTLAEWQEVVAETLGLHPDGTDWLKDPELLEFLKSEVSVPAEQRLSAGNAKGLY